MKDRVERASRWIYGGIWGLLVDWFCVPEQPPSLPTPPNENPRSFRPAAGFLAYLKFYFWIGLVAIDVAIFVGWVAITAALWPLGIALAVPALVVAVVPDILAYIAIHLRYDTTWYVITSRSLRIRRGIWIIHETTTTFENVQNIKVSQGPVQRLFGIASLLIDTAGGGGSSDSHGGQATNLHQALIEGVANAHEIRDLILAQLRRTNTGGLGDEAEPTVHGAAGLKGPHLGTDERHLAVLREIRDLAVALAKRAA